MNSTLGTQRYSALYDKYRDTAAILKTEDYAKWSLPTIYADPDLRDGKRVSVARDYQSVGAVLTNHLSSKLASLLFPATQSFFRIDASSGTSQVAQAMGVNQNDVGASLANLENGAYRRIFLKSSYHQLVHTMKLLITTGNCLLYRNSGTGGTHAYSLRQYSYMRDGAGVVWDIFLKERTQIQSLPADVQVHFKGREEGSCVELYTRAKRERREIGDVFVISQEVEGHLLGNESEYPEAICPFIPVVWNLVTGETYGRGLVEDYAGDFAKLSQLSEALALYEIESCRVLHMAKPGSGADIDSMAQEESGAWVAGDPNAVAVYEAGDYNKIQALRAELDSIEQRLAPAFMYAGNQRDAERVTAEEIRQNAQEAEMALGGVYSSIADSLHIPLAHILCWEVNPSFINELLAGGLTLSVLTGVAALGRTADVDKLVNASQILGVVMPVLTQSSGRFDPDRIIDKVLLGVGLNPDDYCYTEEELKAKQEQQAKQQQAATQPVDSSLSDVSGVIAQGI